MVEGLIPLTRQIARFDEAENGKTRPNPADTFVLLLGQEVATGSNDWLNTLNKNTLLSYEAKTYTDYGGAVPSGYARQRLGLITNLIGDTFFPQPGNPYLDGQAIYLAGAAISGLTTGTPYYVVRANSVGFSIAARPGGAPLTGLSATGMVVVKASGSYNPDNKRVEMLESVRFVARNNFMCSGMAIVKGGVPQAGVWLDGFDEITEIVTVQAGHNLITGDEIAFYTQAFSGAGLPSGLGRGTSYWVRVLNPTQFTLHDSRVGALANTDQVVFGNKPNGLYDVWMTCINGEIDFVCMFGAVIQVLANQNLLIQVVSYLNNWGVQIGR